MHAVLGDLISQPVAVLLQSMAPTLHIRNINIYIYMYICLHGLSDTGTLIIYIGKALDLVL